MLDAEKGSHLSHAASDGGGVIAQTFKAEGQLMPYLVGDNLIVGGLLDKADTLGLCPLVDGIEGGSLKIDLTFTQAMGRKNCFELAEQGGFAAARRAAEDGEITRLNGQVKQQGNTGQFMHKLPALLEFITASMTLEAGDLVTTGTPAGIGPMEKGDVVEVEIPGIGILRNFVR